MGDRVGLRLAVGGVLFNAMNYPEIVRVRILGQDITPLTEKVVAAVLDSRWLAERDAETRRKALMDAANTADFYSGANRAAAAIRALAKKEADDHRRTHERCALADGTDQ